MNWRSNRQGELSWSPRWISHFLDRARVVAEMSKDPSTKTGAVIVRPDKTVCSEGFNGFPMGMDDSPSLYADREEKYERIIHCEMNALIFSRDACHDGYVLVTWPFISCHRCAVHMLQAGIRTFIAPMPSEDALSRWADKFDRTKSYIEGDRRGATWIEVQT